MTSAKNNALSILDHFPSQLTPRTIQMEILNEIEEKINSGYKKIIISAPTGVGKSAIGIALTTYFGNSFMVTASKNLQDQYIDDYPDLHPSRENQFCGYCPKDKCLLDCEICNPKNNSCVVIVKN